MAAPKKTTSATRSAARRSAAKRTTAGAKKSGANTAASKQTATKTAAKKTVAKKTPAKKTVAKKAAAKKAVAKRAPAKKAVAKKAPAKKAPAKKAPAKKAPAKKAVAKKTVAKKAPAKKAPAKKAPAKKAVAKKTVAKKAVAKKTVAKETVAKKTVAKKAPAKKTVATKAVARKAGAKQTTPSDPTTRTRQTVPPKRNVQPKQKSILPSLLSNDIPEQFEVPKPRGTSKDGISYTKDFDVKFLKAQREELLARRAAELARATRLEDEATSLIEDGEMGDVQFDDEGGEGDTMVVQRDLDRLLSGQARQTVEEIDAALERIERGTYGYSIVSGRPIPRERLEAIPETTVLAVEKISGAGLR